MGGREGVVTRKFRCFVTSQVHFLVKSSSSAASHDLQEKGVIVSSFSSREPCHSLSVLTGGFGRPFQCIIIPSSIIVGLIGLVRYHCCCLVLREFGEKCPYLSLRPRLGLSLLNFWPRTTVGAAHVLLLLYSFPDEEVL